MLHYVHCWLLPPSIPAITARLQNASNCLNTVSENETEKGAACMRQLLRPGESLLNASQHVRQSHSKNSKVCLPHMPQKKPLEEMRVFKRFNNNNEK